MTKADEWNRNLERWTVTRNGSYSAEPYFIRLSVAGEPDSGAPLELNNGAGTFDERTIVDAGFLELVRLGIRSADDPLIARSLSIVDRQIRVETPNGPAWYRYNHDGYGEKPDGRGYDGTGVGRLWPLLTGERGEYEVANGRAGLSFLQTMANTANDGYMIPEQVWDEPQPAPAPYGYQPGKATGSASPLAWAMAQYVRLARAIAAGKPVETPAVVSDRYATGVTRTVPETPPAQAKATTDAATRANRRIGPSAARRRHRRLRDSSRPRLGSSPTERPRRSASTPRPTPPRRRRSS